MIGHSFFAAGSARCGRPGLGEALVVCGTFGTVAAEITAFYARPSTVPHARRGTGRAAGLGQALVFLEHPVLPVTPPIAALSLSRLSARTRPRALARAACTAAVSIALGARAAKRWDVEYRRTDGLAITAISSTLALTLDAVVHCGIGGMAAKHPEDSILAAFAVITLVVSLPWILADAGIYIGDIPLIGRPYLSHDQVHLGHHHGIDGSLLVFAALALSRQLPNIRAALVRETLSAYLSFLLVYGAARAAQDAWHEQIFKRGWTTAVLPEVVRGGQLIATPAWGLLLAGTALVHARLFRRRIAPERASR